MPKLLDKVNTKIVGVTMGDEAALRQLALKTLAELPASKRPRSVDLVPEPDNRMDEFAVRVMVNHPDLGRIQLGYISAQGCICAQCDKSFPKNVAKCDRCGKEEILRDDLAWKISQTMRDNPEIGYYADITAITGGEEGKESRGMNILIRAVVDRSSQPWRR